MLPRKPSRGRGREKCIQGVSATPAQCCHQENKNSSAHTPHCRRRASSPPASVQKRKREKKNQNPRPHHDAQTEINSSRLTTSVHKNKTTETLEENTGGILVCNPGMQQQDMKPKAQSKSRSLTGQAFEFSVWKS